MGFRPTALRLANELNITGEVKNSGGNVQIIAQGENKALVEFSRRLIDIFKIESLNEEEINQSHFTEFKIVHSENDFTVLAELMKEKEQLLNERNKWEE